VCTGAELVLEATTQARAARVEKVVLNPFASLGLLTVERMAHGLTLWLLDLIMAGRRCALSSTA